MQEWTDRFDTYLIKALGTIWYYFNAERPPFNDVRVRRAAALALDKRAILNKTLFGHGEIMHQYYPQAVAVAPVGHVAVGARRRPGQATAQGGGRQAGAPSSPW